MSGEKPILRRAIDEVSREKSELREEIEAFKEFREAVSRTHPQRTEHRSTDPIASLRRHYELTVMPAVALDRNGGETVEENLEAELSPGIADALSGEKPYTQRLKRKLLVQTNAAIESRTIFHDLLDTEKRSLETAAATLRDIRARLEALPDCTVQSTRLEQLLDTLESIEELEQECEHLITRRQEYLAELDEFVSNVPHDHSLTGYLYQALETTYPVLSAVAEVFQEIQTARPTTTPSKTHS
jgi:DNA repair exonuclease SbcCD ATPase subunit